MLLGSGMPPFRARCPGAWVSVTLGGPNGQGLATNRTSQAMRLVLTPS